MCSSPWSVRRVRGVQVKATGPETRPFPYARPRRCRRPPGRAAGGGRQLAVLMRYPSVPSLTTSVPRPSNDSVVEAPSAVVTRSSHRGGRRQASLRNRWSESSMVHRARARRQRAPACRRRGRLSGRARAANVTRRRRETGASRRPSTAFARPGAPTSITSTKQREIAALAGVVGRVPFEMLHRKEARGVRAAEAAVPAPGAARGSGVT